MDTLNVGSSPEFSIVSLLISLFLILCEEVNPVEEVEYGKDAGEEDPREDVNLHGSKVEIVEPGRDFIVW